jgi:hypothetical protein
MSNEKSNRSSRRGRRRYFRPAKDGAAQQADAAPSQPQANKQPPQRQRKARRKARSRQRNADESRVQPTADVEYTPPTSVFIYTHSAHPEMRDSYEFRPDHFSKVGRRLEEFQIDISSLFAEETTDADELPVAKSLPKPVYHWDDWEEE